MRGRAWAACKVVAASPSRQSRDTVDEPHAVPKEPKLRHLWNAIACFPVAIGVNVVILTHSVLYGTQRDDAVDCPFCQINGSNGNLFHRTIRVKSSKLSWRQDRAHQITDANDDVECNVKELVNFNDELTFGEVGEGGPSLKTSVSEFLKEEDESA